MKKFSFALLILIIGFLIAITVTGCSSPQKEQKIYAVQDEGGTREYITFEIDGCQYLRYRGASDFSHKGNCTNPIHGEPRMAGLPAQTSESDTEGHLQKTK